MRTLSGVFRSALAVLFWLVAVPPAALIAFPWTFITRKVGLLYRMGMGLALTGCKVAGARVTTVGLDKIPAGTYLYMCNHVSNLDPPILCPLIPGRTSMLAKKTIWRIPILGPAMNLAEIVPVDRENRASAIRSLYDAAEVLRHGVSLTLFPEGTRSRDGRLQPFKKGPFHMAMENGFPIVPITILGTYEMMPRGSMVVRPGRVTIIFHPPVDPKQFASREDLMHTVWETIHSALPAEQK